MGAEIIIMWIIFTLTLAFGYYLGSMQKQPTDLVREKVKKFIQVGKNLAPRREGKSEPVEDGVEDTDEEVGYARILTPEERKKRTDPSSGLTEEEMRKKLLNHDY